MSSQSNHFTRSGGEGQAVPLPEKGLGAPLHPLFLVTWGSSQVEFGAHSPPPPRCSQQASQTGWAPFCGSSVCGSHTSGSRGRRVGRRCPAQPGTNWPLSYPTRMPHLRKGAGAGRVHASMASTILQAWFGETSGAFLFGQRPAKHGAELCPRRNLRALRACVNPQFVSVGAKAGQG